MKFDAVQLQCLVRPVVNCLILDLGTPGSIAGRGTFLLLFCILNFFYLAIILAYRHSYFSYFVSLSKYLNNLLRGSIANFI